MFNFKVIVGLAALVGLGYGISFVLPYIHRVPPSIGQVSGASCVAWSTLRLLQWAANR